MPDSKPPATMSERAIGANCENRPLYQRARCLSERRGDSRRAASGRSKVGRNPSVTVALVCGADGDDRGRCVRCASRAHALFWSGTKEGAGCFVGAVWMCAGASTVVRIVSRRFAAPALQSAPPARRSSVADREGAGGSRSTRTDLIAGRVESSRAGPPVPVDAFLAPPTDVRAGLEAAWSAMAGLPLPGVPLAGFAASYPMPVSGLGGLVSGGVEFEPDGDDDDDGRRAPASTGGLSGAELARWCREQPFQDSLSLMDHSDTKAVAQSIVALAPERPILQGFLRKEGKTRGSWKRRWFVLRRASLTYLKQKDSPRAQGVVDLDLVLGLAESGPSYKDAPSSFLLLTPGRTYALQAPSDSALHHWLHAIAAAVRLLRFGTAVRDLAGHPLLAAAARPALEDVDEASSSRSARHGPSLEDLAWGDTPRATPTGGAVAEEGTGGSDPGSGVRKPRHAAPLTPVAEVPGELESTMGSTASERLPKRGDDKKVSSSSSAQGNGKASRPLPSLGALASGASATNGVEGARSGNLAPASHTVASAASIPPAAREPIADVLSAVPERRDEDLRSQAFGLLSRLDPEVLRKRHDSGVPRPESNHSLRAGTQSSRSGRGTEPVTGGDSALEGDHDREREREKARERERAMKWGSVLAGGFDVDPPASQDPHSGAEKPRSLHRGPPSGHKGEVSTPLRASRRSSVDSPRTSSTVAPRSEGHATDRPRAPRDAETPRAVGRRGSDQQSTDSRHTPDAREGSTDRASAVRPAAQSRAKSASGSRGRRSSLPLAAEYDASVHRRELEDELVASGVVRARSPPLRPHTRHGVDGPSPHSGSVERSEKTARVPASLEPGRHRANAGDPSADHEAKSSHSARPPSESTSMKGTAPVPVESSAPPRPPSASESRGPDKVEGTPRKPPLPSALPQQRRRLSVASEASHPRPGTNPSHGDQRSIASAHDREGLDAEPASGRGASDAAAPSGKAPVVTQDDVPPPLPPSRRRFEFAVQWVNSLNLAPPLPPDRPAEVARQLRSGLLLCAIVEATHPRIHLDGVTAKPRTRASAIANLDKAIAVIWRSRVEKTSIPPAAAIFDGDLEWTQKLLCALFEAWCLRPSRGRAALTVRWISRHLAPYQRRFPAERRRSRRRGGVFWEGLWADLMDGIDLALLAHYFAGDARSDTQHTLPLNVVFSTPVVASHRLRNLEAACRVLEHMGVPALVRPEQWVRFDRDDDVALAFLAGIVHALHGRDSSLPTCGSAPTVQEAESKARAVASPGHSFRVVLAGSPAKLDRTLGLTELVAPLEFADGSPPWDWDEEDDAGCGDESSLDEDLYRTSAPAVTDAEPAGDSKQVLTGPASSPESGPATAVDLADGPRESLGSGEVWRDALRSGADLDVDDTPEDGAETQLGPVRSQSDLNPRTGSPDHANAESDAEVPAPHAYESFQSYLLGDPVELERQRQFRLALDALEANGRDVRNPRVRDLARQWATQRTLAWAADSNVAVHAWFHAPPVEEELGTPSVVVGESTVADAPATELVREEAPASTSRRPDPLPRIEAEPSQEQMVVPESILPAVAAAPAGAVSEPSDARPSESAPSSAAGERELTPSTELGMQRMPGSSKWSPGFERRRMEEEEARAWALARKRALQRGDRSFRLPSG